MRFFLILFFVVFLFSADLDFDGVDDSKDFCPRTPLLSIVDKNGCSIDKKLPFNFTFELGVEHIYPFKVSQQYLKNTIFFKSYDFTFFLSRTNLNGSFKDFSKIYEFSKRFYNKLGYVKFSFSYYPKTYYNHLSDRAFKTTFYLSNWDVLFFYKLKHPLEKTQKNKQTFFLEKFIKYPKIIYIPFFYLENSYYSSKLDKYIGLSAIVRFKRIYNKFGFLKPFNQKGIIFSISLGINY